VPRRILVKGPIINTYFDRALLLDDMYDIGDPFSKGQGIDKTSVQNFLNFDFNYCSFSWVK
jgi:hypothetical protein